ncbi:hypothetical protein M436DRAFT_41170 [Aureobasidium namibiae CBS 147.97]|uniref:Thioesterase domain-containing protein n=1 Tax=Aureobasidium namibiae CBS 147.97 TaxID=1043004 RepID=A0A074WR52_9PEZI|nr:uncharacterized protein M436DRAFT_41170 [Aureobasidium namibiae CBS 147.97]KEQ75630.1 hypothetical protein M436DRAFT_41170 [Aureobasidium namibiae CBS 147.97]
MSPPSPSHAYFASIPWTSSLLTPSTITAEPRSRTPKPSSEDSLIATTLLTPTTIPHCLIFYPRPSSSLSSSASNNISILFALGSSLNGHPAILHGGITAVLLDESMGMLLLHSAPSIPTFTKTLNVEYTAPIRTPGIVLVEVEVVERRGRGVRLQARVLQKEREGDEGGLVVCARGEGVFVKPREVKL